MKPGLQKHFPSNGRSGGKAARKSGLLNLVAALALACSAGAATTSWTGEGGSDLWSDAGNWQGGLVPGGGDEVLYTSRGTGPSLGDFSVTLDAIRFAAEIQALHEIHAGNGVSLTLNGGGILNNSVFGAGTAIRQFFFADAGGALTFQNSATITGNLPVDLDALGGASAGAAGGLIHFEDNSTASGPPGFPFTGIRVRGAEVAGAFGGELRFKDDAAMGPTAGFNIAAGNVVGAAGGMAIFEGRAFGEGLMTNSTGDGLGGRTLFRDATMAGGSTLLQNDGATHLAADAEGVTQFLGSAVLAGTVVNYPGNAAGAAGGRTEFRGNARFDRSSVAPELGGILILNRGSSIPFGQPEPAGFGGSTLFYDDARVVGANTFISNGTETEDENAGLGGTTEFLNRSRAGPATITNSGTNSSDPVARGGGTLFRDESSAESAHISAGGGVALDAVGGSVEFSGMSTAANATLTAMSGIDGGLGGRVVLLDAANGAAARVSVEAGAAFEMSALTMAGTTLGSIEGAGGFFLGSKTLTVGSNDVSTVVSGVIDGTGASLTKVGAGTMELGGLNTYTGPTNVIGGGLLVTGTLGNAAVSVASGATLGGTGTVGGAVTVADGGIVAPGNTGAGTLTVGALSLNAGSILNYQLGSPSDRIDVNGPLTLDGTVNISALSGLGVGVYRLLNYTGAFTDNVLALGSVPAGTSAGDFSVQTDVVGQVNLVLNGGAGDLLFWDGAGVTSNGVVNGGNGTWSNAATNWTNSAGTVNQAWTSKNAVFSGTAGTVTLDANVTTTGLQFVGNGYGVNAGAGTSIALSGTAPIRVDSGASVTINAALTGGALDKTGIGTLLLSASNSYSGGTTVSDGGFVITNPSGLGLGTGPVTVLPAPDAYLRFTANGSAGAVAITNRGGASADGATGFVEFINTSTAGTATISNLGNSAAEGFGAFVAFDNTARAGSAVINNLGAAFTGPAFAGFEPAGAGRIFFRSSSTAESSTLTNLAGLGDGLFGGQVYFLNSSTAGTAAIVNRGGTSPGALGGSTLFTNSSSTSSATLTSEGGSNGGLGGTIRFSQFALGSSARVIFLPGDTADGLLDISALLHGSLLLGSIEGAGNIFLGAKALRVGQNGLSTEFSGTISDGGASAGMEKTGTGRLTLAGDNTYNGSTLVSGGELAVRTATGQGLGNGTATVLASATLRFIDNARAGASTIVVRPSASDVISGGRLVFSNNASARNATIQQFGSTQSNVGTVAGTSFLDSSSAGAALIFNLGGIGSNSAHGGRIRFFGSATAGTATISNVGAGITGADSAFLQFFENSNAGSAQITNSGTATKTVFGANNGGNLSLQGQASGGSATIVNGGAFASDGSHGATGFNGMSSAAGASITNAGGAASGAPGGLTTFRGDALSSSSAGAATILNARGGVAAAKGGSTQFVGTSLGGSATVTNQGANGGFGGGRTEFRDTANAESANFFNGASEAGNAFGGITYFFDSSRAGSAVFDNEGAKVADGFDGDVQFYDTSSADAATITNRGKTHATGEQGGIAYFLGDAKAGTAMIANEGSAFANGSGIGGGSAHFSTGASAEQATIVNRSAPAAGGSGGTTLFGSTFGLVVAGKTVTADRATITNEGSAFGFGSGLTIFQKTATAGSATFMNEGGTAASGDGGQTRFHESSTAGSGMLINRGGTAADSGRGVTFFDGSANAGTATITSEGGAVANARGGIAQFRGVANGGSATIITEGSAVAGGGGGRTTFTTSSNAGSATLIVNGGNNGGDGGFLEIAENASGGPARMIANAGGIFDISRLSAASTPIGSIEGAGTIFLGSKLLIAGGNGRSETFSGVIADGGQSGGVGGRLQKAGPGVLTLSGANTFTGTTTVAAGILRVNGSLAGPVSVQGGILGGNGMFNGSIVVGPGGVVSPGASIGSFTSLGPLSLEPGATFELEIDSGARTADQVSAPTVTIGGGVTLRGLEIGTGTLPEGLKRVIIDNTSGTPTVGTFAGLPEGAPLTVGRNLLTISYVGGDGNDVEITALGAAPESNLTISDLEVTNDGLAFTLRGKVSGGTAAAGKILRLEGTNDLQVWRVVGNYVADAAGTVTFEVIEPAESKRFFLRVIMP